jgi:hypothetical protein
MFKSACLIAAAAAVVAFAAPPASAKHKWSCYDYAWQSQQQKDCLAHPEKAAMHKTHHTHKKKGGMKHMDMKDMKKS